MLQYHTNAVTWPLSPVLLRGSVTTLYNYNTQAQLPSLSEEREAKKRRDLPDCPPPSCPDLPQAATAARAATRNLKKWRGDNDEGGREGTRCSSDRFPPRELHMRS